LHICAGTNPQFPRNGVGAGIATGITIVIGSQYFLRQAATLLEFARSTNDPKLAATLIGKAADLLSQIDESSARQDPSPQPQDVQIEQ
jgi:hypothetical protein